MSKTEPVTAAGGVVFQQGENHPEVLLIYRRGVWDLPKGKLEDGETIRECAVREVAEEVGAPIFPEIKYSLVDTYHEYDQGGVHYGKITHWFAMQFAADANFDFEPETDEGIEKVKWMSLTKAKSHVGYQNLVEVLTSFEQLKHRTS